VEVPAVTQQVQVNKMVEPAREVKTEIPEEKQTVTSTKQTSEGRYEWRSILCETNATKDKIRSIQSALKSAGYDPGPLDGVLAQQTMRAVNEYQRAKKLPVDPYLNMETVRSLGVNL
jgi:peptidoglycan hydrolase-like protein with peptidoglycan-binding domain